MVKRRKARVIKIGSVRIGGNNPVAIQSMAKYKTSDASLVIRQIRELESCGCEIVRLAVKDDSDAAAIKKIKTAVRLPIVADIHFDWQLAMAAIKNGADKIRLNPGNIYKKEQVSEVARAAKANHIPIRVGLNSGSLPKEISSKRGGTVERMVQGALNYIKILEKARFSDIVVSLKASNIIDTVAAYEKIAGLCDYPLHLGLTATGLPEAGAIKSSIAIGSLLLKGIGDTVRISLTDKPEQEVKVAKEILASLNLRDFGVQVISCPTCGRCEVGLVDIVRKLEAQLSAISYQPSAKPVKIAVMGCMVNGPGEAKEADIGIAFGRKEGMFFRKGRAIKKIPFKDCAGILLKELGRIHVQGN